MHPHYGVGTSTEPIVISDDEDEAAFVEFTLEQRISSPTDSVDYDAYHNAGWQQEQPVYVEDDSIPENATGTSLYPPEDEVGTSFHSYFYLDILYYVHDEQVRSASGQIASIARKDSLP